MPRPHLRVDPVRRLTEPVRPRVLPRDYRASPQRYQLGPYGRSDYPAADLGAGAHMQPGVRLSNGPSRYEGFDWLLLGCDVGAGSPATLTFSAGPYSQDRVLFLVLESTDGLEPTVTTNVSFTQIASLLLSSDRDTFWWGLLTAGVTASIEIDWSVGVGSPYASLTSARNVNTAAPVIQSTTHSSFSNPSMTLSAFAKASNPSFVLSATMGGIPTTPSPFTRLTCADGTPIAYYTDTEQTTFALTIPAPGGANLVFMELDGV